MSKNYVTESWLEINRFSGLNCPVNFICDNINSKILDNRLNIFLYIEPPCIIDIRKYLIDNSSKYDYILTHDNDVLNNCKNAKQIYFGSTWITKEEYSKVNINNKKFKISTLIGQKNTAIGHNFRQKVLNRQCEIKLLECYRSKNDGGHNRYLNPVLMGSKFTLFENYQYSLVIENGIHSNWFTEKLIDCLICKSIPIYYGDPNIKNIFNTSGWIILENDDVDNLINKISILEDKYYSKYISTIEENFETSLHYSDFYENVNRVLCEINKEIV